MPKASQFEQPVRQALRDAAIDGGWTARQIAERAGCGIKECYRLLSRLRADWTEIGTAPGGAKLLADIVELGKLRAERLSRHASGHDAIGVPRLQLGDEWRVREIVGIDARGSVTVILDGPSGQVTAILVGMIAAATGTDDTTPENSSKQS